MQSRHPMRETLLEGDSLDSRSASVAAAAPSVVCSPAAPSSSGRCLSLQRWFSSLVPDLRSRVAFVFAFLCALAVSVYWLQLTIRSKWMFQQQHPTQVVSYDAVDSLPALFGLQFSFQDSFLPARWTYLRRVTPFFYSSNTLSPPSSFIRCTDLLIEAVTYDVGQPPMPSTFCESINADGSFVLNPANAPEGELDGYSAGSLPLSAWPLQFTQGQEMCFQVDVLLNRTGMLSTGFDETPMFSMVSLSNSAMLTVHELVAAGLTSASNPAVQAVLARSDYATFSFQPFGSLSSFHTTTTRTIQVSGDSSYVYESQLVGSLPMSPSTLTRRWQRVINGTQDATERAALQAIKDDPSSLYATAWVCTQPRSFIVQEIALFHLYGWSSFLSDCGGFLSILSIVFVALFPLTVRVTRARDFLPIWIFQRLKRDKLVDGADHQMELRAMQPSITVEP